MSRYSIFLAVTVLTLASLVAVAWSVWFWIPVAFFGGLSLLGLYDVIQSRHSILRNYPVIGHMRFLFEGIRPEIRQYLIESDQDEEPFSRDMRSIIYQRAKGVEDKRPFGTRMRVYDSGYQWLTHSVRPVHIADTDFRVRIGGPDCTQPYDASIYNISAMSFGALSGNAIQALNKGAKAGGFAHDTGEGGVSIHHREGGGDLIYQVGSGYFGCRTPEGVFDPEKFRETAANPQIKLIELKLSQGAKPGHGGVLPASKITPEIAEARGVPMGEDCVSPASHSAFSTPIEMMEFIGKLRELSDGKPVGFKMCIGHRREFMCMVKAMLETDITPDFIVIDGKEGGTGAAPLEFANRMGMPLVEGLTFAHNTLRGAGVRDRIKIGASGKIVTAFDMAKVLALGADWANSARGFMFSIGCIQAQACHTNACPVGVATQDPLRQRALDVADKSVRVARFHRNTLKALGEMTGAAGLESPGDFLPYHLMVRETDRGMVTGDEVYPYLPEGFLLRGEEDAFGYLRRWRRADANDFSPADMVKGT
ncbi:putative glutamate synthase [NADPH] large chain [Dinoroseobacter shibae DFL 12 = DSM 16493]|jgi:glutamate synthase domain-containing protein 2|uniref:Putative glutamate synthase [NADPH] large chain n=1 Tax=Dinoroseobacter shibae (strain DSM 16493 / NCIMB 14021 / DFL 12) TaxID=398580 RepID=A8LPQ4_DINSH|nr:FMN-binding glutamate synthase family protein [Dinoroseobacter shibae]ABV93758.1 putative glutamate synthase [NADPH] large chain [Dinoroseobacter shibae DFL 12 = DSM 16493]URF45210.1 FMN-binding glutamate synthase family protein [Dinoroseobacter shibae]URF49515.1 FMN-binding glutamate synthase family protein [Dinoroseobacter shibae]